MRYIMRNSDGMLLLDQVKIADSFWKRFWGLMGRAYLPQGEGLLLKGVKGVHTCFMRFPIQVIYLDRDCRVMEKETLKPWRCGRLHRRAAHVLEVGIWDGERMAAGMELQFVERDGTGKYDDDENVGKKRGGAPWKSMEEMN